MEHLNIRLVYGGSPYYPPPPYQQPYPVPPPISGPLADPHDMPDYST
jgi:hypothetical protein